MQLFLQICELEKKVCINMAIIRIVSLTIFWLNLPPALPFLQDLVPFKQKIIYFFNFRYFATEKIDLKLKKYILQLYHLSYDFGQRDKKLRLAPNDYIKLLWHFHQNHKYQLRPSEFGKNCTSEFLVHWILSYACKKIWVLILKMFVLFAMIF